MRVYIVSTYPTVRAGLSAIVREQPEWSVAGANAPEAITRAASPGTPTTQDSAPDIILADLEGVRDVEALESWLAILQPSAGLVVLATLEPTIQRGQPRREALPLLGTVARAAEDQGIAFGALRRDAPPEEIVAAITAVAGGLITLDRRLGSNLIAAIDERVAAPAPAPLSGVEEPLTARELEVLQLMALGLPNKTIASRLHISEHTAKFHVSSIMMKLGAASRTEAVTLGARRGLLIL
jgi:NarL family two-component system response regulator YdfI